MDIEQPADNIHPLWVPNADAMRQHLDHLFGGYLDGMQDGLIELAWTDPRPEASGRHPLSRATLFATDAIDDLVAEACRLNATPQCNVYIGAALRKPGTFPTARASDDDFLALTSVYTDLDDDGAPAIARSRYGQAKPTMVVVTGKEPYTRAQMWWRLDEPITDPAVSEALLRGMATALGGDHTVTNPARVMRLAGSIAWPMKPGRQLEQTYIAPLKEPGQPTYALGHLSRLFPAIPGHYQPTGHHVRTADPVSVYDGFGHQVDGREQYMTELVWGAVVDWRRERPTKPSQAESIAKAEEKYWVYEEQVNPRLVDPEKTKTERLEAEGRGPSAFHVKWQAAMRRWDSKVAEASKQPGKPDNYRAEKQFDYGDEFKTTPPPPPAPIEWLDMSNWDIVPVPTRQWAIRDRVPLNQVGLFSGEGGTGKSIIELMKNVAHVTGREWLGSLPEQGPAFYLGAEDEAEEIHIRLAAIAKHYGTTFRELSLGGLKVLPLLGKDSMLCVQAGRGNHIEITPLYRQLYEAAGDLKPKNISIDTLSRAFGGDEINRVQVYAFAMHMQALAKVAQGSVTILSHPSLSGMASGSGISGSTAWHGAFRFRQYLKGIKEDDDSDPADQDLRELEFKKNQYGPKGRPIILRYKDGLFLPVNGATDPERVAREARADGCFVNLLRKYNERGDDVSHKPKSHYFAPRLFADETAAKEHRFRESELRDAMRRLMDAGRVLVDVLRKKERSQARLILSPGS